jgi:hypothetical protein
MTTSYDKREVLTKLRAMLTEVFCLRLQGASYTKLARAQGYVDGCMRLIIDTGIAGERELLELVAEQRRAVEGPAIAEVLPEPILAA